MQKGFTVWFTGLSGAGKTTVSKLVEKEIRRRGRNVEMLDGDVIRTNLCKDLGFSKEDRDTNIRRIVFVCKLLTRNGAANMVAAISPYHKARDYARSEIDNFVEVFVECPVEVCIERDPKGLYKRALAGEIKHFTGISDPYEEPLYPELMLETDKETPDESAAKVVAKLEELGYLEPASQSDDETDEDEAEVRKRLEALGYI